jgi:transposase
MARPTLQVKGYTSEAIKSLFRKDERYTIGLRLYAVYQVSLGQSSRNLAILYNTSFKQITNWVHQFEQNGIEGLKDKEGRGRRSRLDEEQEAELKNLLSSHLPSDYGFNTATWTGPLLIEWIKSHYSITYKKAQVYNIIKKLGFSYQKSKGIFPETDKNKQASFKEALKKTARRKP